MIKIKMETKNGVEEIEAYKVLQHINSLEFVEVLQKIEWTKDIGKINFLTGKSQTTCAIVSQPLDEKQAIMALNEYKNEMGIE